MNIWKEIGAFFLIVVTVVAGLIAIVPIILGLKISIPDSVFLSLILAILILFGRLACIINRHGEALGRTEQKKTKLKPDNEILFILRTLADRRDSRMERKELIEAYTNIFEGKKILDFNPLVSKLKTENLIYAMGYDSKDTCGITDAGLAYYDRHRARDKHISDAKKKRKENNSTSPTAESSF